MLRPLRRAAAALALAAVANTAAPAQVESRQVGNEHFALTFAGAGISSLARPGDAYDTDYVKRERPLGDFILRYREVGAARWREAFASKMAADAVDDPAGRILVYEIRGDAGLPVLRLTESFVLDGSRLQLQVSLANLGSEPVEIGDLGFALDFQNRSTEVVRDIFEKNVVKHHFVSGHGSYVWWERPNGVGPYLVMTPQPGTWLEYFDLTDQVRNVSQWPWFYVHSGLAGGSEARGTWRQAHTMTTLAPAGVESAHGSDHLEHGFTLQWAPDLQGVRDVVYGEGLFDVTVMPGMTVPDDLEARVALRTRRAHRMVAEFPEETTIEYLGERAADTHVYRVRFSRLGENALKVLWDDEASPRSVGAVADMPAVDPEVARVVQAAASERPIVGDGLPRDAGRGRPAASATGGPYMLLEFFVTEPIETLVKKRAAHVALKQQHRDPSRWYDGLFSVWDMRDGGVLRGPDDTDGFDGWWGYVLATDDPALSKAPFVAAKNEHFPDAREIEALEYYIDRFVWGGLQRTAEEQPYPYGVYGVPNWHVNRTSLFGFGSGGKGLEHIWRMFDYPHMVMLYLHMHHIATLYPELVHTLDADGYLERAYQTARAYFLYPYEILPWYEVYKWGTMNELVILEVLAALEEAGRAAEGSFLRAEFDKKIKYFVYDDPYPFRSEYSLDTTGFESTHALAVWALESHVLLPDRELWTDRLSGVSYSHPVVSQDDVRDFLERQMSANVSLRGTLEPAYYYLGSDYRARHERYSLSYMSQMGGQAVLDYALRWETDPMRQAELLRLGYASILAPWALMNTSRGGDGGFWYDGPDNDGASGWGFTSQKYGSMWIRKDNHRGPWYYDGEIDLGYGAALRAAATIVFDDPIFGLVAYGGEVREVDGTLEVVPRDGLRQRLWVLREGREPVHLVLHGERFAPGAPIKVAPDGSVDYRTEPGISSSQ